MRWGVAGWQVPIRMCTASHRSPKMGKNKSSEKSSETGFSQSSSSIFWFFQSAKKVRTKHQSSKVPRKVPKIVRKIVWKKREALFPNYFWNFLWNFPWNFRTLVFGPNFFGTLEKSENGTWTLGKTRFGTFSGTFIFSHLRAPVAGGAHPNLSLPSGNRGRALPDTGLGGRFAQPLGLARPMRLT